MTCRNGPVVEVLRDVELLSVPICPITSLNRLSMDATPELRVSTELFVRTLDKVVDVVCCCFLLRRLSSDFGVESVDDDDSGTNAMEVGLFFVGFL